MTRDWVEAKIQAYEKEVSDTIEELKISVKNQPYLLEEDTEELLEALDTPNWDYSQMVKFNMLGFSGFKEKIISDHLTYDELLQDPNYKQFRVWEAETTRKAEIIYNYWQYNKGRGIYERYMDSEPVEFDGDIIITDPGYIVIEPDTSDEPKWEDFYKYKRQEDYPDYDPVTKQSKLCNKAYKDYKAAIAKWDAEHPRDWERCSYGQDMSVLGLKTWMTRDTIYGDWSCHTFNQDTKEPIGQFCADAGLVGVFLLEEVLKYNPEFDYHIERKRTTTLIKDFHGTVRFVVNENSGTWEDDSEYHKKGDTWVDYDVQVIGDGINKVTGEPIRFITKQTGL